MSNHSDPLVLDGAERPATSSRRGAAFWRHPATVLVSTLVILVVMIGVGLLIQVLLAPLFEDLEASPLALLSLGFLGALPMSATVVLLVLLVRRFAGLPPRSLGLAPGRRLWLAVPGAVAALLVMGGAALVGQAVSGGTWSRYDAYGFGAVEIVGVLVLGCLLALCSQAFPEELLFRGHLMSALAGRLPSGVVIALSTVLFGVLHLASQSNAEGARETSLYAVSAAAFGFAAAAFFHVTGSVWGSVGVHWGVHIGIRLLPFEPDEYATVLVAQILGFVAVGVVVLIAGRAQRRRQAGVAERAH